MRIRILKQSKGRVDGVVLSDLVPDRTYEVRIGLGVFLIASGAAEEDQTSTVGVVTPLADLRVRPTISISRMPQERDDDELLWFMEPL